MPTIPEISELQPDDGESIAFIQERLSSKWDMTKSEVTEEYISPSLNNEGFPYIYIAKIQDQFAGKIFLVIEPNGYLSINNQPWITALFVDEAFRGRGIARELIQTAKDTAKKHGYNAIYLDTASSKGYYDRIGGWETVGTALWKEGNKEVAIMKSNT